MFTGLIGSLGAIQRLQRTAAGTRLTVAAPPDLLAQLSIGDSISVSGVCLTAVEVDPPAATFSADLAAETLERTSLAHLASGSIVNLELPMRAADRLGGHIVQGHVDGIGTLLSITPAAHTSNLDPSAGDATARDWWMDLELPAALARYVVHKGSIAVEGISLTVAQIENGSTGNSRVAIAVIPHTYAVTNLSRLQPGAPLNIEVDVLAKYAERRSLTAGTAPLAVDALIRRGF